jgi:hypothetical protein
MLRLLSSMAHGPISPCRGYSPRQSGCATAASPLTPSRCIASHRIALEAMDRRTASRCARMAWAVQSRQPQSPWDAYPTSTGAQCWDSPSLNHEASQDSYLLRQIRPNHPARPPRPPRPARWPESTYGLSSVSVIACSAPSGYTTLASPASWVPTAWTTYAAPRQKQYLCA